MKWIFYLIEFWFAGYALSSVEGRVAMEFFDLSEAGQSKKYVLLHDMLASSWTSMSPWFPGFLLQFEVIIETYFSSGWQFDSVHFWNLTKTILLCAIVVRFPFSFELQSAV